MTRHLLLFCLPLIPALLHSAPLVKFDTPPKATYSHSASVSPRAAVVFTRSYTSADIDAPFASQASGALGALGEDLEAAGLKPQDVVNLRAYLVAHEVETISNAMPEWNDAFTSFFSDADAPPTRTTIGVSTLLVPDALIAIDAIVATDHSAARSFSPSIANQRLLHPADRPNSLRAIQPYSSWLITSGVLASPDDSGDLGPMADQTKSALSKLETTLQRWGLGLADLAFVRILLSPDPENQEEIVLDRDGYQQAWDAYWQDADLPAPPFSAFAAPGFSNSGRLIEIEFYAAFPDAAGPFFRIPTEDSEPHPAIIREGSASSFLSSSAALARDTRKTWFAGVISTDREDIYGQGVEALLTLEERMQRAGVDFQDTAQLRAYLALDGPFRPSFDRWNRAYKRFFDHPKLNPEKPVRTAFPILTLPNGALIEIETLAVSRP